MTLAEAVVCTVIVSSLPSPEVGSRGMLCKCIVSRERVGLALIRRVSQPNAQVRGPGSLSAVP